MRGEGHARTDTCLWAGLEWSVRSSQESGRRLTGNEEPKVWF